MGRMIATHVVMQFTRRTPLDEGGLDGLADACLDALNTEARFLAFGPVVSVHYDESAVEVDCNVCTEDDAEESVDEKIGAIQRIVQAALAAADYATTAERTPALA